MLFQPVLIESVRHRQGQLLGRFIPDGLDDADPAGIDVRRNSGRKKFAGFRPDLFCFVRFHYKILFLPRSASLSWPATRHNPIFSPFFTPPRPILDSAGRAFGPLIHSLFTAAALSSAPKTAPTVVSTPMADKDRLSMGPIFSLNPTSYGSGILIYRIYEVANGKIHKIFFPPLDKNYLG